MIGVTDFDAIYADALRMILDEAPEKNERTGKRVRAMHGAVFQFSPEVIPLMTLRDIKPLWACAEAVWFMGGKCDAAFMEKFGFKVWRKFANERGVVESATGLRWRSIFGVDQLKALVRKLSTDKSDRHGVLMSWDPFRDVNHPGTNVPCLVAWHFHIIGGRLHVSVLQRSGDMYFGVPHDVLGCRVIQELLAAGLDVAPGAISYLVSNAHLYEDQWDAAEEMVARAFDGGTAHKKLPKNMNLHKDDFVRAMTGDDTLPFELCDRLDKMYEPWPAITGPKLVV